MSRSSESTPMKTCTMFWRICTRFADTLGALALMLVWGAGVSAQDSWPTYHGDFTGQRHSALTQITPANVNQLSLVWAFQTGEAQWTFYSTPPPGTPNSISGGATGGQMWMTGTYDPALNLMFVGTGNPTPVLNGKARPGDNRWTCSIVALNPDTGTLAWAFQASPHDTHDWDASEVPVLVDGDFAGAPRKMLLQASRNGYFFVLDRTNGKSLLTAPYATVNWAKGIDQDGHPIPDPAKEPTRDGVLIAPNESGGTNYRWPSYDPQSGTRILSAHDAYVSYP